MFGERSPKAFGMDNGGTVSLDISSLRVVNSTHNNCSHIEELFHLDVYVLNDEEYGIISNVDYDSNYCHNEFSEQFQIENCWYFTTSTLKFAIPINGSYSAAQSVAEGSYHILMVNPCNITYSVSVECMEQTLSLSLSLSLSLCARIWSLSENGDFCIF